jgi:uncharacterized protein
VQTLRINVAGLLKETTGGARNHTLGASAPSVAAMVPDARPSGALTGTVRLLRSPRSIFARVRAGTEVILDCSRCLEDAVARIEVDFDSEYFPSIDVVTGSALKVPDDDMAFMIDHNHELDLAEPIRQELVVATPMHPLCSAECAGLCVTCGHNLNEGPCACSEEVADGRLAQLRNLLGPNGSA